MQPIRVKRSIFYRLPEGCSSSVAEFVALLDRRVAYCEGVIAALEIVKSSPRKRRNAVLDALVEEAAEMRREAKLRISRIATEIVAL